MKTSRIAACVAVALFVSLGLSGVKRSLAKEPEGKVTLEIMDWKATQELVAAQKGKIVVLDAWSTSCDPCVEEFPNLVALHRKFGADVACISMSCDYAGVKKKPPEFYRERVQKFLEKQGATFTNILSSVPADELFEQMDIPAIPAVYVYGRDGKLVKLFENSQIKKESDAFTYKDVTKLVAELVAKK